MSDDLQQSITTSAGSTFAAFDKINAKQIQMEGNWKRMTKAAKDYQAVAGEGLTLGQGIARGGKILKNSGGGIFGRAFAGAGLEGAWGTIAVSAGVAMLAFKAFNAVVDHTSKSIQARIESEKEYKKAIDEGQKVIDQQATAGYGRSDTRARLIASGGQAAVDKAAEVSNRGILSDDQSRQATSEIYAKFGNTPRAARAVQAVENLVGRSMPFNAALEAALKGGNAWDDPMRASAREASAYDRDAGRKGAYLQAVMNDPGSDSLVAANRQHQHQAARMGPIEEAAAIKDNGAADQLKVARAANPILTAIGDVNKAADEHVAELTRLAAAQNWFTRKLKDLGMLIGTDGSFENQKRAAQNNRYIGDKP